MHLDPTTHEHGSSGKVYTYEGDYDLGDGAITWQAVVTHAELPARELSGSIPMTSPGLATVGEQAVRDAIVQQIDRFDDRAPATPG